MDLSPPSLTRSPASPPDTCYPADPIIVDQQYKLTTTYTTGPSCSAAPEISLPPLEAMGAHQEWVSTHAMHASSSSAIPSILSAEYDPFANYESLPGPYGNEVYPPPPPQVPSPGEDGPSRSPSLRAPAPFTARIKMETTSEYPPPHEVSHYPSPPANEVPHYPPQRSVSTPFTSDASPYPTVTTAYLQPEAPHAWPPAPKPEYQPQEHESVYPGPGGVASAFLGESRRLSRMTRQSRRQPRRLTTKEDAVFTCPVKGCGKLFSRSYNFKAHKETHDENREYPFPCQVKDCNKKFVRKTDLQRHNQSVHMKERNHKCDYCGRLFARKDTLRRHMDDGCSKRYSLPLHLESDGYENLHRPMAGSMSPFGSAILPPMAPHTSPGTSGLVAPVPPPLRPSPTHSWGR